MKNVLYISPNGYMGGAEKFVVDAVRQQRSYLKDEADVLFFNSGVCVDTLLSEGLKAHVLKNKFKLSHLFSLFKALKEIRSQIKNQKYKVIHSTMAYGHLVMSLATVGLPLKRVWFQHGPVSGMLDKLASLFPVDVIIFNSSFLLKEHLKNNFDFYHSQKVVIHLGIKKNENLASHQSGKIQVLMAGRLSPAKGYHLVLDCLKEWQHEDWIEAFHFTIRGGANSEIEKDYAEQLKQKVQALRGLADLLPFTNQTDELYQNADILIQPSIIEEGFGLVLAEAMARSLLVIGPSYGGGQDILHDGLTGCALDFRHSNFKMKLKTLLQDYLQDSEKYQEIKLRGKELIENQYSVDKMMHELSEIHHVQ